MVVGESLKYSQTSFEKMQWHWNNTHKSKKLLKKHIQFNTNNTINKLLKNIGIEPRKFYSNAESYKKDILSENKNLSGIYCWTNQKTGDTYVGSGLDLAKRIRSYYQPSELERNPRHINRALLKYGHDKFKLEILEYCDKDKLMEREQYYLDSINPSYNILKKLIH